MANKNKILQSTIEKTKSTGEKVKNFALNSPKLKPVDSMYSKYQKLSSAVKKNTPEVVKGTAKNLSTSIKENLVKPFSPKNIKSIPKKFKALVSGKEGVVSESFK